MKQRADISYMLFLAVTAAVGGLLFGYDTAVISGTVELVTARFGLDSLQRGMWGVHWPARSPAYSVRAC